MSIDPAVLAGGLTVGQRLDRIERKQDQILEKFSTVAQATEVSALETRVGALERTSVSKGTVWGLAVFIVVQMLVIIGLGLGLVYEVLKK